MTFKVNIAQYVVLLFIGLAVAATAQANPNHQVVDAPFAVHGTQFSAIVHKKATESYEAARNRLFDFLEKEKKGDLQRIQAKDVGATYVQVTRMQRAGMQLQLLGEPAGADFERRAYAMHSQLDRLAWAIKGFPATQKYIEAFRQFLGRSSAARANDIIKMQELIQKKQFAAAETELYRIYDQLELGTIFLTAEEKQSIYSPFGQIHDPIVEPMKEIRAAKAKELLHFAHKETLPHYSTVLTEMNMAIEGRASKETATWRGEELSRPQLVTKFAEAWRAAQVQALKAQGITWAQHERRNSDAPNLSAGVGDKAQEAAKPADEYAAFSRQVMASITRLIDAEAARATETDVSAKYVEFLRVLAPVVRETNSAEFAASINQSLSKLRAKSAALDEQVKAYDAATDDLLRWRARVAAARASSLANQYLPIDQRLVEGTMSKEEFVGLFTEGAGGARPAQLTSPAPDVMTVAAKRLIGQKAMARDVIRLPGDSDLSVSRYAFRTYATLPAPLPIQSEIQSLEQDLFISAETPPLTLKAMQAIVTAQRGDMVTIGGDISGLTLEAVITHFATISSTFVNMTVLGQFPSERVEGAGLTDVLMQFNMTPRWVQHDYFFVPLAPPAEATASLR